MWCASAFGGHIYDPQCNPSFTCHWQSVAIHDGITCLSKCEPIYGEIVCVCVRLVRVRVCVCETGLLCITCVMASMLKVSRGEMPLCVRSRLDV